MLISVVIATYQRRDLLARTLPTVLDQDLQAGEFEVIVVVDGSTDGSLEYLTSLQQTTPALHVLSQTNKGQAAAINRGLHAARGDVVLFLDDDILCTPTLLREHVAAHACPEPRLVYGPVLIAPESVDGLGTEMARTYCDDFFRNLRREDEHKGWGHCMAAANTSARRSVLLGAGGLDENFTIGNDFEFGVRLEKSGLQFAYQGTAIVHQIYRKTVQDVLNDAKGAGAGEIRLCRKHPEARSLASVARLGAMSGWKRVIIRMVVQSHMRPDRLLRPVSRVLYAIRLRRAALRLLMYEAALSVCAGAVRELGSWRAFEREFGMRLPVLLYHNVGPKRPGGDPALTISPSNFERQIRWLAQHGYASIRTCDWVAWLHEGKSLPQKPVLLTFDDAYRDFAEFGLPILERHGFTATVFLVTSEIGGSNTWDQRNGLAAQELMNAEEIKHWAARGIEFAAHSHTHPDLTAISRDERACELKRSRSQVEALLGAPVPSFAYPFGFINREVCEQAREYFDLAFTCETGVNDITTDPIRLRRAPVVPKYGAFDPRWQVTLGFNPFIAARTRFGLWRRRQWRRIAG